VPESSPSNFANHEVSYRRSSHHVNRESTVKDHITRNDDCERRPHNVNVTTDLEPDWYLQEWAAKAEKRQADLVTDLGWVKNHAHRIWHSKQPYRRDIVNAVARWLGIQPYELLMPPEEAMLLRNLRQTAKAIAASDTASGDGTP